MPPYLLYGLAGIVLIAMLISFRPVTLMAYERGLLLRAGKVHRLLNPGQHWILVWTDKVLRVDMRRRWVVLSGQELLSADTVNFKISLMAEYKVSDVQRALLDTQNYQESLYLVLQSCLRDVVGAYTLEDLLPKRGELAREVLERAQPLAEQLGLTLLDVRMRDLMLSGELRSAFAETLRARKQGQAVLERARGETAALRNLLNATQLLEDHPRLWALRILQTL